ncbi:MAG TPA: plastocyanin/azurin family copper-binding protein [Gemmatimonadaceae bacterium]|nr:plastocyanin/azurin family copper-binding protein [Gemmatimonadaceae bacterium]
MMRRTFGGIGITLAAAALMACSGDTAKPVTGEAGAPTPAASEAPAPTGDTIIVELITDENGNYFKPNKIEAERGDLIRFTLTSGVHNVHFLPDSNPGRKGLPPVSDFLQLPGQTYDLVVNLDPGHYYFQCDPHAALGMVGKLEVED